jgi:hypothetical protein
MPLVRSRLKPFPRPGAALVFRRLGIANKSGRRAVATERPELRVSQSGFSSFNIAAVTQPHELGARVNPSGGADRSNPMSKVMVGPR